MHRARAIAAVIVSLAAPIEGQARKQSKGDEAFLAAKEAFASLQKDSRRNRFRDQWLKVVDRFEAIARRSKNDRAPDALFNLGRVYTELSRISSNRRDVDAAIEAYERLARTHPKSSLVDDAWVAVAALHRDARSDPAAAREALRAAMACKGDMRRRAEQALAALGPEPVKPQRVREPVAAPRPSSPAPEPEPVVRAPARAESEPAPESATPASPEDEEGEPVRLERLLAAMDKIGTLTSGTGDEETEEEEEVKTVAQLSAKPPPRKLDPEKVKALREVAEASIPLSVQVGLKVRRVIIDAGHGGHDTGAIGPTGVREKDVTLAISRKLKARLEEEGFEVLLTRDDDRFVKLEDRTRFANRKKGDLFVSVHCNAHKSRKLRGVETYTLNITSDRYAIRLAARENAASERTISDLQLILADLATKANTDASTRLATAVQSRLVEASHEPKRRARNLGVKQAVFYVLLGAKMPSILVETAFLSNPHEEKRLADPEFQQSVADAIASGIVRFNAERDALATAF